MRKYLLVVLSLIMISILLLNCPMEDDDNSKSKNNSTNDGVVIEDDTGTVTGTVNDDATITLEQNDGTTQETNTSDENPDFQFDDVPEGDAKIIIDINGTITEQDIVIVAGEETQVNPFGSTQEMPDSFTVKVYEVENNGWSTTVDDILVDNQLGEDFYSKEINIPTRAFDEGFPGVTDRFEWFGVVYEGQIKAPVDGTYTFKLTCDDGAKLYINGETVVNGDGVHPPHLYTGTVDLTAGEIYDIKIEYFQGPRYHICLVLETQIPGGELELFHLDDFAE